MYLRAKKTVELLDRSFLFIKSIVKSNNNKDVQLRGYKAFRINYDSKFLVGKLPRRLNKLCFVHEVDLNDNRPMLDQSVCEVFVTQVKQIRKLYRTNRLFIEKDELRFREL